MRPRRPLLALALALMSGAALAHKPSDSYLTLTAPASGTVLEGRWDIALRDLDFALAVDANHDGEITWRELKAARQRIDVLPGGVDEETRHLLHVVAAELARLQRLHARVDRRHVAGTVLGRTRWAAAGHLYDRVASPASQALKSGGGGHAVSISA